MAISIKFETVPIGVVANVIGHDHGLCTILP
jgi:hypothetical protein